MAIEDKKWMKCGETTFAEKDIKLWKCGRVNGGGSTRQNTLSNRISEGRFLQSITRTGMFVAAHQRWNLVRLRAICDIEVPEHLGVKFANFLRIFKSTPVSRVDSGPLMKGYAEKNIFLNHA